MPKSSKTTWLNLRDLDVFGTPITGVGVEEGVKSLPMLETLHLAECRQLTNKGLLEILRISRSKAFDTCDVNILLSKLEHYGFCGTSNLWFNKFLNGRKQFTLIRGVDSSLKEISCGEP